MRSCVLFLEDLIVGQDYRRASSLQSISVHAPDVSHVVASASDGSPRCSRREEQDSESYANGTAVEAGEGLGMDTEDMDGSAGSAALELIDVAVSAASTNSVAVLKGRLLRAVAPVDRGVAATPWDMDAIEEAAQVNQDGVICACDDRHARCEMRAALATRWDRDLVAAARHRVLNLCACLRRWRPRLAMSRSRWTE